MTDVDISCKRIREYVTHDCLWMFADELLMRSIRLSSSECHGPRGQSLVATLQFIRWLPLQLALVLLVTLTLAVEILLKQLFVRTIRRKCVVVDECKKCSILFVGFGARAEERIFAELCQSVHDDVVRVNYFELAGMFCIQAVHVIVFVKELLRCFGKFCNTLSILPAEYGPYKLDWMVSVGVRLARYTHSKLWFTNIQSQLCICEAYFLSADTTAFAAVDAGLSCHYIQHGLISKDIIFPDFRGISALTFYEARYLRNLLRSSAIIGRMHQDPAVNILSRVNVVIASARRLPSDMNLAIPFIGAVASLGLTVHVRPFPGEDLTAFWSAENQTIDPPVMFTSDNGSFTDLMATLRPIFVVSWGSTTLVDALYAGIIPISIADVGDSYVRDTVYPLMKCCLHWPRDAELIAQISGSQESYDSTLRWLRDQETELASEVCSDN